MTERVSWVNELAVKDGKLEYVPRADGGDGLGREERAGDTLV